MTIDFLDKVLLFIKNNASFVPATGESINFSENEKKLLERAFYKLEKDGYVYSKEKQVSEKYTRKTFFISFEGLLALDDCPSIYKNRPYRWKSTRQKLAAAWNVVKIFAVLVNALIVLLFTYLTYYKKP